MAIVRRGFGRRSKRNRVSRGRAKFKSSIAFSAETLENQISTNEALLIALKRSQWELKQQFSSDHPSVRKVVKQIDFVTKETSTFREQLKSLGRDDEASLGVETARNNPRPVYQGHEFAYWFDIASREQDASEQPPTRLRACTSLASSDAERQAIDERRNGKVAREHGGEARRGIDARMTNPG